MINNIGNHDFEQSGPEQWFPDGWDVDRLVLRFQGSAANLSTFLATLTPWDPSTIDANMFLQSYPNDYDRQWPTVDLNYIGKKGGVMPPPKSVKSKPIQSATSATSSAIFPAVADIPVTIRYRSRRNAITVLSTTETTAEVPDDPDAITSDDVISWFIFAEQPGSSFPDIVTWLLDNAFVQKIVADDDQSEEVVPGELYRITKSKTMTLFPYAPPS